jgi:DNA processing protein
LTRLVQVANCIPLVTPAFAQLQPEAPGFPDRLTRLGWRHGLYVRGTLTTETRAVAIVGARAASRIAIDRAHVIGRHFAARGVHVVSGGAIGIDGAAHRGALDGGGTTTVVLGTGIDVTYPDRHAALFERVVARGGALISMLPPGVTPRRSTFVQRNPLIAALADLVIVVEADVRSGSLSTARAARLLGRPVAAWPGSRGCDRLLASGAALVEHEADAVAALDGQPRYPAPIVVDPITARIRQAIADGACGVDEIVRATGLPARTVLRAVLVADHSCPERLL